MFMNESRFSHRTIKSFFTRHNNNIFMIDSPLKETKNETIHLSFSFNMIFPLIFYITISYRAISNCVVIQRQVIVFY